LEEDHLMSAKAVQHGIAIAATAVAAIASGFQARRGVEKADHEARSGNASQGFFANLCDALKSHKREVKDPDFNEKHFRRVAALWGLIMIGAILALSAEGLNSLIDLRNWR
jgi:hypothetical protein